MSIFFPVVECVKFKYKIFLVLWLKVKSYTDCFHKLTNTGKASINWKMMQAALNFPQELKLRTVAANVWLKGVGVQCFESTGIRFPCRVYTCQAMFTGELQPNWRAVVVRESVHYPIEDGRCWVVGNVYVYLCVWMVQCLFLHMFMDVFACVCVCVLETGLTYRE